MTAIAVTYQIRVVGKDADGRLVGVEFEVRRQPGVYDAKAWAVAQPVVRRWATVTEVEVELRADS